MTVLILVLMEDTLGGREISQQHLYLRLNPCSNGRYSRRAKNNGLYHSAENRLNPCSNGRYSRRYKQARVFKVKDGLNPCSNGRYSRSAAGNSFEIEKVVLILVLMEDTLGEYTEE